MELEVLKTFPGINPEVTLDHFTEDEKTIIKKLSSQWYITNGGGQIKLGPTSTYRYFLMKPTDLFQEMFTIEDMENWDGDLSFFDKFKTKIDLYFRMADL